MYSKCQNSTEEVMDFLLEGNRQETSFAEKTLTKTQSCENARSDEMVCLPFNVNVNEAKGCF